MASSSNPKSTPEKMPPQIEVAIAKKEKEIDELTEEWKKMMDRKEVHLRKIEEEDREIKRMKGDIKAREARVRREQEAIHHILQDFAILQAKVNEKQAWIDETKSIFK